MYDKFDVIYQKSTKNLLRLIEFHSISLPYKTKNHFRTYFDHETWSLPSNLSSTEKVSDIKG